MKRNIPTPLRVTLSGVAAALCAAGIAAPPDASAHAGHTDRAPWDACATAQLDAPCEWTDNTHARYVGTCRAIGQGLMCVRNQPVIPAPPDDDGSGEHPAN